MFVRGPAGFRTPIVFAKSTLLMAQTPGSGGRQRHCDAVSLAGPADSITSFRAADRRLGKMSMSSGVVCVKAGSESV